VIIKPLDPKLAHAFT